MIELKRKLYGRLLDWKQSSQGSSALLIEGARRVGKSTIAQKFGRENYRSVLFIDFAKAPNIVKNNFEENLNDLDRFFQILSLEYNTRLYRRETLVIFDEIQKFPKAREAIKYLVEDGRYDYLETGSLISIRENVADIVIPSEEDRLQMYPLDFEEYLMATGEDVLRDYIADCWLKRSPLENRFHRKAETLFREYLLVGGMPQSVVAYLDSGKDFYQSDQAKRRILSLYRDDIKKAAARYSSRVSALFEGIPGFLSTHEKKVVLSKIDAGKTYDQYDDPLFWLGDSMMCNLCYRCNDPNVGLALNRDDSAVKCYMGDTGLLVSLAFSEGEITSSNLYKQIMAGKLALNEGMLHENAVAQMLVSQGRRPYFYTHYSEEKHRTDIEIDFLITEGGPTNTKVRPIEVKSSKNYTNTSYAAFRERFGKRIGPGYIVHPKTLQPYGDGWRVPSYMFPFALKG